ncbi:hypothetical protein CAC42_4073 [Sphaceloma murrayae]|uniref:Uncharacterized protein n=1 Tax=Sphaceloma murrayae TaxID=2082308 RepID=A0A2K1QSR2_9PEZI|nr:hypothetical protein CAC42_4073 [Sphaceloma murrayae]
MSFRKLCVAALISASAAREFKLQQRQSIDISQEGCNGIIGDYYGALYCCPGVFYNDTDESPSGSGYCCVGAYFPIAASQFSDRARPSLTLPTSSDESVNILPITETQSCRTTIMFTDAEYTSKANAYGAGITGPLSFNTASAITTTFLSRGPTDDTGGTSVEESGTRSPSTTGMTGTTSTTGVSGSTSTAPSSVTTGFSGPAITASSTSATAASASSSGTSASSALGGRITSGPMAGAFMVVGGILAAAL